MPLLVVLFFFFNDTATTEIYTLSLHDALPIYARRDHATAAAVLPVQHLRGLVLVADGDRPAPDHHGPEAGEVVAASPLAGRALARAAGEDEPPFPARARAVQLAEALLEERLHRRGRRPQDLGALHHASAPQACGRGGARVARGAARRPRRPRRHLPRHGQLDPRDAPARLPRRPPAGPRPAQGDRGAWGRDGRRAPLPAVPVAGVGHRARDQRADRERPPARARGAAPCGGVAHRSPDPRPG